MNTKKEANPLKKLNFEQGMGRLEKMVEKIEDGKLPLDDSLKLFEEGMELTQVLETQLDKAQGKIETLLKK